MASVLAMWRSMHRRPLYQPMAEPVAEALVPGSAGLGPTGFDATQLRTEIHG